MIQMKKSQDELSERFADKKASTTAGGQRRDIGISSRKTQKSLVKRCAVWSECIYNLKSNLNYKLQPEVIWCKLQITGISLCNCVTNYKLQLYRNWNYVIRLIKSNYCPPLRLLTPLRGLRWVNLINSRIENKNGIINYNAKSEE